MANNDRLTRALHDVGDRAVDALSYVQYGYDKVHEAADKAWHAEFTQDKVARVQAGIQKIADKIFDAIDDRRFD